MAFYDLTKDARTLVVKEIHTKLQTGVKDENISMLLPFFADDDTYIRKNAYLSIGRIYKENSLNEKKVLSLLIKLLSDPDFKVRQTAVNAAGEIGMNDFQCIENIMRTGLTDPHHSVRNAVIGSIKKMGQKNPLPVLHFAKEFLHHPDKEIRREICHGIELRGRTHPQDILPLLRELQHDKTARVRNTLVHVLGQIAYKKGCLETVVIDLKSWENKELVQDALAEIIDVHDRYKNFSVKTQEEAIAYIAKHF
jgi:HEAT repeat protein